MPSDETVPPALMRRAADIARGPHACPSCESPTFTEPPIPWVAMRDYVARCEACERPVSVRVDRDRILRRRAGVRAPSALVEPAEAMTELLDARGRRAFLRRLALATLPPATAGALAFAFGASVVTSLLLAALCVVPSAMWAPAALALALAASRRCFADMRSAVAVRTRRTPRFAGVVDITPGRWDQWLREERLRERERADQPDAVLRELERVLGDRELRRVRVLAERGEVPAGHLDDLLRFRRAWSSVA